MGKKRSGTPLDGLKKENDLAIFYDPKGKALKQYLMRWHTIRIYRKKFCSAWCQYFIENNGGSPSCALFQEFLEYTTSLNHRRCEECLAEFGTEQGQREEK